MGKSFLSLDAESTSRFVFKKPAFRNAIKLGAETLVQTISISATIGSTVWVLTGGAAQSIQFHNVLKRTPKPRFFALKKVNKFASALPGLRQKDFSWLANKSGVRRRKKEPEVGAFEAVFSPNYSSSPSP